MDTPCVCAEMAQTLKYAGKKAYRGGSTNKHWRVSPEIITGGIGGRTRSTMAHNVKKSTHRRKKRGTRRYYYRYN